MVYYTRLLYHGTILNLKLKEIKYSNYLSATAAFLRSSTAFVLRFSFLLLLLIKNLLSRVVLAVIIFPFSLLPGLKDTGRSVMIIATKMRKFVRLKIIITLHRENSDNFFSDKFFFSYCTDATIFMFFFISFLSIFADVKKKKRGAENFSASPKS